MRGVHLSRVVVMKAVTYSLLMTASVMVMLCMTPLFLAEALLFTCVVFNSSLVDVCYACSLDCEFRDDLLW